MSARRMTVVVTGASSPIGRAVRARLDSMDDVSPIYFVSPRNRRAADTVSVDVADDAEFRAALLRAAPHAVIHLAAVTGAACDRDRRLAARVNVESVRTITSTALDCDLSRVVFASSAAVYGDRRTKPASETDPAEPTTTYGELKLAAEIELAAADHLETLAARIFNVWGADLESSLIARLRRSTAGEPVAIRGPDDFVRDYVHVDDVARALVTSLTSRLATPHVVVNIGSGVAVSNAELIRRLETPPTHYRFVPGERSYSVADTVLSSTVLGFAPTTLL